MAQETPRAAGAGPLDSLGRSSAIALATRVAGTTLGALLTLFLARVMGGEEYGMYAWSLAFAGTVAIPVTLGLPTAIIRLVAEKQASNDHDAAAAVVRVSLRIVLLASCAAALLAWPGVWWWTAPTDSGWMRAALTTGLLLIPVMAYQSVLAGACRAASRIGLATVPQQVVGPGLGLIGALTIHWFNPPLNAFQFISLLVLVSATVTIVQWWLYQHGQPLTDRTARPALPEQRRWLRIALPLMIVDTAWMLVRNTDVLMLGALADVSQAGLYSVAARVAELLSFGLLALRLASASTMARCFAVNDLAGLQEVLRKGATWVTLPTVGAAIVLIAVSGELLGLFGAEFAAARTVLIILALTQVVDAAFGPVAYLLGLSGHEKLAAASVVVTACLNIVLNAALIPSYGMLGAAIATTTALTASKIWAYVLVRRHIGVRVGAFALIGR